MFQKICLFLLFISAAVAAPFDYDLHETVIPGTSRTMICFHGYGASYHIAEGIKKSGVIDATLVSFNFPAPSKNVYGTIDELLPAFYVLKKYVLDAKLESVDLYGFSAGGGAVINVMVILHHSLYEKELQEIGIGEKEKQQLLSALQKGLIILDAPMKSVEEIISLRGSNPQLRQFAKHYGENKLRPIDSVSLLKGLSLDMILHFQKNDGVLSNRDDDLFIQRILEANPGTSVIIGNDGGHSPFHQTLARFYAKAIASESHAPLK